MRKENHTLSESAYDKHLLYRAIKSAVRSLLTLACCLTLAIAPQIGDAQPSKTQRTSNASTQRAPQQQEGAQSSSDGKVIEFKQLRLEGNIQRPSAAYFIQRKRLKFKGLVPKRSFISKIKQSVTKAPF